MIQIVPQMCILVAVEPVDFRKGIDGLAGICRRLDLDPMSGCLFVFVSRSGASLRILAYDSQGRKKNLHLIVNNSRFLILPWVQSKNPASRILSLTAKRVAADWQERYRYEPVLPETFVEKERFRGTCYKAGNWVCVRETQGRGKLDTNHERKVPVKTVRLYPLRKDFRECLHA